MSSLRDRVRSGLGALLRPSGPPPRPSWRAMALDGVLALALAGLAILAGAELGDQQKYEMHVSSGDSVLPGQTVQPDLRDQPGRPDQPVQPDQTGRADQPDWAGPQEALSPYQPFLPIEDDRLAWALAMVLVVTPLVWRRRFPLAALWAILVFALVVQDDHATVRLSFYVAVIAAYSAAVHSPFRYLALVSLAPAALLYSELQSDALPAVPSGAVPVFILASIAFAADGLRRLRRRSDEHRERLASLQRDQVEALHRATELERARIARELHDVVTHNVSVMVIQAGAARKVLAAEPGQAEQALLAVEAGGRAAMAELRQVMGLLTPDDERPAELAPQPGLDRLAALVGRVRDTGLPVELSTSGEPRPVPSGVELTAYRVVQEALTNTVKHAAGARASVLVEYTEEELRVQITDTGGRPGASAANGNGRGLLGLRERLAVHGGTLQAGPRLAGGYRVDARIPLPVPA